MLFDDPGTSVVVPSVSYRLGYEPCDVFAAVRPFLAASTSTSRVIAESNETVMDMFEKMFSSIKVVYKRLFIGDVGIRNGPHSLI